MITITAVIKNNDKILPYFLRALYNLNYDRSGVSLVFIDDHSADLSFRILQDFKNKYFAQYRNILVIQSYRSNKPDDPADRILASKRAADLKNILIDVAKIERSSHQLHIDPNILVGPDLVKHLKSIGRPVISTIIFNDDMIVKPAPTPRRPINAGYLSDHVIIPLQKYDLNKIYAVDVVDDCYMIDANIIHSGIYHAGDARGENAAYAEKLAVNGIPTAIDTHIHAIKIPDPNLIPVGLVIYFDLFGVNLCP